MTKFVEEETLVDTFPYFDVTVAGRTLMDHNENVNKFYAAVERKNFTLNPAKTIKRVTKLHVLGYVVGEGVIAPDPERLLPP